MIFPEVTLTIRQAPRGKVTQRLLIAATALVLGAWVFPSLAATGTDTRSDPPMDARPMSLSTDRELPVGVIDRGAASAVDSEPLSLGDTAAETALDAVEPPTVPRAEILLRRIIDEARAREPRPQQPRDDDDFNPPLAVDKSDTLEDPPGVLETDPAEAAAGFPGFGADDLLRYRRQMYRTDI